MVSLSSDRDVGKAEIRIPSRYIRYVFLAVAISLTFRIFQYFPGMSITRELWIVALFGFLILPYLYWKIINALKFDLFELYVLAIMIFVPLLSSITAWQEFGQPLVYGVLAQRTKVLGVASLALLLFIRNRLISLRDVEKSLILLAWGTLGLYMAMTVLLDPSSFTNFGNSFVNGGNVGDLQFRFRTDFIVFGFFYYSFVGFRNRSMKYWLLAFPFLMFLVLMQGGRSLLLSLAVSFLYFVWRWGSVPRLIAYVPKFISFGLIFLLILYVGNPEYMSNLASKFGDAFTVVLTGNKTQDASANARIGETLTALPFIAKHWLFGNGDISNRWHGGYEGVLGGYFYPSDVGIVGVIYVYGVIGAVLFAMQFLFAIRFARKASVFLSAHPLLDAVKAFLLFYAIHSLITGGAVLYSEVGLFYIALLYCFVFEIRKQTAEILKPPIARIGNSGAG